MSLDSRDQNMQSALDRLAEQEAALEAQLRRVREARLRQEGALLSFRQLREEGLLGEDAAPEIAPPTPAVLAQDSPPPLPPTPPPTLAG